VLFTENESTRGIFKGRRHTLGTAAQATVFMGLQPEREVFVNFQPPAGNKTVPVKLRPEFLTDKEAPAGSFVAEYLVASPSKVTDSRGQVPLQDEDRFVADGNDSTIYVPVDFDFAVATSYYRAKEVMDALSSIGGAAALVGGALAPIQPLLVLGFLAKLAQIVLDKYEAAYRAEVKVFIAHALGRL